MAAALAVNIPVLSLEPTPSHRCEGSEIGGNAKKTPELRRTVVATHPWFPCARVSRFVDPTTLCSFREVASALPPVSEEAGRVCCRCWCRQRDAFPNRIQTCASEACTASPASRPRTRSGACIAVQRCIRAMSPRQATVQMHRLRRCTLFATAMFPRPASDRMPELYFFSAVRAPTKQAPLQRLPLSSRRQPRNMFVLRCPVLPRSGTQQMYCLPGRRQALSARLLRVSLLRVRVLSLQARRHSLGVQQLQHYVVPTPPSKIRLP